MSPLVHWGEVGNNIKLRPESIHLWLINTAPIGMEISSFTGLLSPLEKARADRITPASLRHKFIVDRIAVRLLLARYVRLQPAGLNFRTGEHGKPYLVCQEGEHQVYFSLASSNVSALIAVSVNDDIGVDIEWVDEDYQYARVLDKALSSKEKINFIETDPQDQRRLFYRYWTAKEALLKGLGLGVAAGPQRLTLELIDEEHAKAEPHISWRELPKWQIRSFIPEVDYIAALATKKENPDIQYFNFEMRIRGV